MAELEAARKAAREEQRARERHAISIQASVRGRSERERVRKSRPSRSWAFQRLMTRSLDTASNSVVRFYIEENETIEILEVRGAGRLLLSAIDAHGKPVVNSAVVFDSSANLLNTAKGKNSAPALWSAPGEHEYTFSLMPLEPPAAEAHHPVGRMTVHFRKVMAFGEADVVNEVLSPNLALFLSAPTSFAPDHAPLLGYQAPPKPRTDHLNPYGRNPRRGSQLQPIAQQPLTQRERPGGIGGAAREMPPSPGGRPLLPPVEADAAMPGLTGYQQELGDRTRDRAANLEAQQREADRRLHEATRAAHC